MKTTQIITFVAAFAAIAAPAAHATGDDSVGTVGATVSDTALAAPLAAGSGNQYDPAVVPFAPDPSNPFGPVYTISPTGPEDVASNVSSTGEVLGTQDFSVSSLGFPVDTFTGDVQYTPTSFEPSTGLSGIVDELSQQLGLGGGYTEEISTSGSGAGTVLPESTGFLVSEYGFGYGNVFEESVNAAGTQSTVGDFLLTPFGDINISPIVDLFATTSAG